MSDLIYDVLNPKCPTQQILDRIASKWTMLVILALGERPLRYSELQRRVAGVTKKMLTQTLRALERDGLIRRRVYDTVPSANRIRAQRIGTEPRCDCRRDSDVGIRQRRRHRPGAHGVRFARSQGSMTAITEWTRGEYTISSDRTRLDLDVIHGFLTASYWAQGRTRERVIAVDRALASVRPVPPRETNRIRSCGDRLCGVGIPGGRVRRGIAPRQRVGPMAG